MEEARGQARKVPVLRSDNSLIEDEFHSLRSRFDDEMRLIEAEMERFKSHMMALGGAVDETSTSRGESTARANSAATSASSHSHTTRTTSKQTTTTTSSKTSSLAASSALQPPPTTGLDLQQERVKADNCEAAPNAHLVASSPLVVDDESAPGSKKLRLRFDVRNFEPEQIVVKTLDNRLQVHAQREQVTPNKSLFAEYNREFLLPASVEPEHIKSTLSADGVLTIEAPLPDKAH